MVVLKAMMDVHGTWVLYLGKVLKLMLTLPRTPYYLPVIRWQWRILFTRKIKTHRAVHERLLNQFEMTFVIISETVKWLDERVRERCCTKPIKLDSRHEQVLRWTRKRRITWGLFCRICMATQEDLRSTAMLMSLLGIAVCQCGVQMRNGYK